MVVVVVIEAVVAMVLVVLVTVVVVILIVVVVREVVGMVKAVECIVDCLGGGSSGCGSCDISGGSNCGNNAATGYL
ncbi:hypothetical protein DPMN_057522 [Dreissena polymorpha]|uniref:Uncharacterized protein n=1 Tax=Dreissena polymorpha TaxID=45954 RepID=A0A9D4C044_DREPO|nr:hypothetical protein DPMN_057522 [Dreissena polymorpha]